MKINLLLLIGVCFTFGIYDAQAQAKRYTLFEHFTQASCAPCAVQNPAFQSVYVNNEANVHHVAYHTVWPGFDPMNTANPTEVADMVTFYSVSGVPDMIHDGKSVGSPTAVSQNLIDKVGSSPVRIELDETLEGDTAISGTIRITTVGAKPDGIFRLRSIAVEKEVNYTSAPGSNGEREFPNVFRRFLIGGSTGLVVNLADSGEVVEVDYSYEINSTWKPEEMYTLAYLQNESSKEVLNSGASNDPVYNLVNFEENKFKNAQSAQTTFEGNIYSSSDNHVEVSITTTAPVEWESSVMIDGNDVNHGDTISLIAGNTPVMLFVDPSDVSGVASYSISIKEPGTNDIQQLSYFVINNIRDLVVVSDNSASGNIPVDFGAPYIAALATVSTVEKGSMGHTFLPDAEAAGALTEVENIYYSIGWSFPALTDEVTETLINHLERGDNLMIAGQDVGWDIMSLNSASNGTPYQRTFYTDYLKANYIDDGSSANSNFIANADDNIYGVVPATTVNAIYRTANTYPDQIDPIGPEASTIFSYSTTKSAGIRVEREGYKVVYLGIGLEQISQNAIAGQIFTITHDWFHGLSSTETVDAAFAELGQAFPNPAIEFIQIPVGDVMKGDLKLIVTDISGRTLFSQPIENGTELVPVQVGQLNSGMYFYRITNGQEITTARSFIRK